MIRVLHIMRSLDAGGIGTFIMNVYREIDRSNIQFDFAITQDGMGEYGEEILKLGGNIYFISKFGNRNILDGVVQVINLFKLCKVNNYDIVHSHYYFANAYFLMVAKFLGVKKRVSHCHNTRTKKIGLLRKIFEIVSRKLLFTFGTDFIGCSEAAAKFLYGANSVNSGKAIVLYNGIDYTKWNLSLYSKSAVAKKYNLVNMIPIIFVGRFEEQKNPIFALETFKIIHDKLANTRLIVVGYGSYLKKIQEKIIDLHISNDVIMLKPEANIVELQALAQVMLAPSLWEGLSIAFIEAQKMETLVFTSDYVSKEVDMGYCKFLPLNDKNIWANKICDYLKSSDRDMMPHYKLDKWKQFNVEYTTKKLLTIYGE